MKFSYIMAAIAVLGLFLTIKSVLATIRELKKENSDKFVCWCRIISGVIYVAAFIYGALRII